MHTLDSRFLALGNCFAHRFSSEGTFAYALSPLPSSLAAHEDEPPERSVVVHASTGGAQRRHTITVQMVDGSLTTTPRHIEIHAGDLVLWSADRSLKTSFRIRGRIGRMTIDSARLRHESVYTHAFLLPGTYDWVDANGSELAGRVTVLAPDQVSGEEEWLESLQKGTLVHVRGGRAEPERVEILVGQTVVWAVEEAPGVTVTDARLLGLDASPTD